MIQNASCVIKNRSDWDFSPEQKPAQALASLDAGYDGKYLAMYLNKTQQCDLT